MPMRVQISEALAKFFLLTFVELSNAQTRSMMSPIRGIYVMNRVTNQSFTLRGSLLGCMPGNCSLMAASQWWCGGETLQKCKESAPHSQRFPVESPPVKWYLFL